MKKEIILNGEMYHMRENELPYLITYKEKSGGSDFSMTMIADLFSSGSKILFITAYPMAKENFLEQVGENTESISYIVNESEIATESQCIIIESGNEELFLKAIQKLGDIHDRVIFVKNIEIFSEKLLTTCIGFEKIILSGDIDECPNKELILQKKFQTEIFFNQPNSMKHIMIPQLEKYTAYLFSDSKEGIIKINI